MADERPPREPSPNGAVAADEEAVPREIAQMDRSPSWHRSGFFAAMSSSTNAASSSTVAGAAVSASEPLITPGAAGAKSDARRWWAALLLCALSASCAFGWSLVPHALSAAQAQAHFVGISQGFFALLQALVPGVFLAAAPVAAAVGCAERGVRTTASLAAALTLVASVFRASPSFGGGVGASYTRAALFVAQTLGGVACPLLLAMPAAAASTWFAPAHRNAAAGLLLSAHVAGYAASLLVVRMCTAAAAASETPLPVALITFVDAGCAAGVALLTLASLPALPRNPPSVTSARQRMAMRRTSVQCGGRISRLPAVLRARIVRFVRAVRLAFARRASVALMSVAGLQIGAAAAWLLALPRVLLETGSTMSPERAQWLGFSCAVACVAACAVLPLLPCARRRHKPLSVLALIGQAAVGLLLLGIAAAPSAHVPEFLLGPTCLTVLVIVLGACCGLAAPLLLEAVVETSYPCPSFVSSALCEELGAVIVVFAVVLGAKANENTGVFGVVVTAVATFAASLALVLLILTRPRYVRLDLDEGLDLVDTV